MRHTKYTHRGRDVADPAELRTVCVSVRLNNEEAALLDSRRNGNQRGQYLRACLLDKIPPQIPPVNLQLHRDLGRSLGNLATVAVAMRNGDYVELPEILAAVRNLRLVLLLGKTEAEISYCHDEDEPK